MADGVNVTQSITIEKGDLGKVRLKLLIRDGAKEVDLPFEVKDLAVEKQ